MSEQLIEQAIQDKNLNAPRLTPALIDAAIVDTAYHVFDGSCLTVCCLTLKNGFTVSGESACASPENFDAEIGKQISYSNARDKIWALEGYLLKQKLYEAPVGHEERVLQEFIQLNDRAEKLEGFIDTDVFATLSTTEQTLLKSQFLIMATYVQLLKDRIALFK